MRLSTRRTLSTITFSAAMLRSLRCTGPTDLAGTVGCKIIAALAAAGTVAHAILVTIRPAKTHARKWSIHVPASGRKT
jgi:hypothetical protein